MALCLLAALLFGAAAPAAKVLLQTLPPLQVAGLLYLGAAAGVLPSALRSRRPRLERPNLSRLGGSVVFGGAIAPVLLLFGLRAAPAAHVSLWLVLEAPATLVLGLLFFGEHATRRLVVAVALIVTASVVLAAPFEAGSLTAAVLVAGACLCWGLDNQLTAGIDGFTASQIALAKGLIAGSTNLALSFVLGSAAGPRALWLPAIGVGAIGYGASLVLYIAGAQQLGAARSQILFATAPLFGAALSWIALGEPVTAGQAVAAALMIAAVALMRREPHGHVHSHPSVEHTHWHRHDDGHHDHPHEAAPTGRWHNHLHAHEAIRHEHPHRPDIHHRHPHRSSPTPVD